MIDHDDVPRFDAVASIQFSGDETYSIVYEEGSDNTYCADDVYFAQIGGEMLPLDTERVQSYLDSITDAVLTVMSPITQRRKSCSPMGWIHRN